MSSKKPKKRKARKVPAQYAPKVKIPLPFTTAVRAILATGPAKKEGESK